MNIFYLLAFLNLCSCSNPIFYDVETTESLLNNLNRKDLGLKPERIVHSTNCSVVSSSSSGQVNRRLSSWESLPIEILSNIFSLLNYMERLCFLETCLRFNLAGKTEILRLLYDYNPYFVFQHDWLNHRMMTHLSSFVSLDSKFDTSEFRDKFEKMSLASFCYEGKDEMRLSEANKYKFQSFIHEMIYGSQELMPTNEAEWSLFFFPKSSKYEYNLAADCFKENLETKLEKEVFEVAETIKTLVNLYLELYKGPLSDEKYQKFFQQSNFLDLSVPSVEDFIDCELNGLNETYFHQFTIQDNDVESCFSSMISTNLFSKTFFDRIPIDSQYWDDLLNGLNAFKNRLLFPEYCKLNREKCKIFNDLIRNPNQSIATHNLNSDHLSILSFVKHPDIYLLEIFSRAVRANLKDFSQIVTRDSSLLDSLYLSGSLVLFDMFLTESPTLINPFIGSYDYKSLENVFNSDNGYSFVMLKKFGLYVKYILRKYKSNPLPLIFIDPKLLVLSKKYITDHFALNYRYIIDFDVESVAKGKLRHLIGLAKFQGKELSFKEIIESFETDKIEDLSNLNQDSQNSDNDDEESENDSSINNSDDCEKTSIPNFKESSSENILDFDQFDNETLDLFAQGDKSDDEEVKILDRKIFVLKDLFTSFEFDFLTFKSQTYSINQFICTANI